MSLTRCVIINATTRQIVNFIEYKNVPAGDVPGFAPGHIAVPSARADTSWTWDGSALVEPPRPPPPDPVATDVKAEAQRRIIALTGKSNLQDCMIKQFNALMRAGQLTDKRVGGEALTAEEEREADTLRAMADKVKAVRAASDVIEAMSPIPADYANDKYWPR